MEIPVTGLSTTALGILARNASEIVAYTDGSTDGGSYVGRSGVGIVLKFDRFVIEIASPVFRATSALSELLAIERAIDLRPNNRNLTVFCDCKDVEGALKGRCRSRHPKAVARVRNKINPGVQIVFVPWRERASSHFRAHFLANQAMKSRQTSIRILNSPAKGKGEA